MSIYKSSRALAEELKASIGYDNNQRDIARRLGISAAYLSAFLAGNREAGPKILSKLGYETTPVYRRKHKRSPHTTEALHE